jgi:hypothetical protein
VQEPPQSTSVSLPFFAPSVQLDPLVSRAVSAGPVPVGVKVEFVVSRILSMAKPSSRIHTLTVCTPVVDTFMVADTLSSVPFLQLKLEVNPLIRSALATAAPSSPACAESLSPTTEPVALPRSHTE